MTVFSTLSDDEDHLPTSALSSSSLASRNGLSFSSNRFRNIASITTAVIPVMYLLAVQSRLVELPRSWRWDGRDFHHDNDFRVDALPETEHLYALRPLAPSLPYTVTSNSSLRATPLGPPPQLEIVISYYDEPIEGVADMIRRAYAELPHWSKKTTIYHKGVKFGKDGVSEEQVAKELRSFIENPLLKDLVDVVAGSRNEGRDGGTHLTHM